jgi:hypothetical protein
MEQGSEPDLGARWKLKRSQRPTQMIGLDLNMGPVRCHFIGPGSSRMRTSCELEIGVPVQG